MVLGLPSEDGQVSETPNAQGDDIGLSQVGSMGGVAAGGTVKGAQEPNEDPESGTVRGVSKMATVGESAGSSEGHYAHVHAEDCQRPHHIFLQQLEGPHQAEVDDQG